MATATKPRVLSAGSICEDSVQNFQGEDLGTIKEVMIDVETGRVAYVVLSFGGVLGFGDKLFAVPFKAMRLCTEKHCFTLDVDKAKLENAQGFDPDNWPDMADQSWQTELHTVYGVAPYWI